MSSQTKIVVLHMKEIIYTIVFVLLGILLILLLTFMFFPKDKENVTSSNKYLPGVYTSDFTLGSANLEVEVSVDSDHINSIRFSNLDESVTTAYPLIQPAMENIADQICESQSLDNLTFSKDNPYTSQIIVNAIEAALQKADSGK